MVSRVYRTVAKHAGVPIIGMGGIQTWQDAAEFILAGATGLGIGTALSPRTTLILGALAISLATALGYLHEPLPWYPDSAYVPPRLFMLGMWASVVVSVAFIGGYAFAVAREARQLSDALSEAELVLAREQHLSALDGLAAAAQESLPGTVSAGMLSGDASTSTPRTSRPPENARTMGF